MFSKVRRQRKAKKQILVVENERQFFLNACHHDSPQKKNPYHMRGKNEKMSIP